VKVFFTNTAPIIKYGIGQAFADLGHEICLANVAMNENWQEALNHFEPDLVFTDAGWGIAQKLLPVLKKRQLPHIYWAIEDPPYLESLSMAFARQADAVFTTCRESISAYRQKGIYAELLMFACHPAFHRRVEPNHRFNHDIAFVGNNYFEFPTRLWGAESILRPLLDSGHNIKIYGNEWWLDGNRPFFIHPDQYGGYLGNEELPALCASVPIVLGLHSVADSKTMMSMRVFEVLGSGGFFISQWTPAVEHLFKNHHHLVWSKSAAETLELVDYYLQNPAARERIALQGQEEVYGQHTYHQRVQQIMPILEAVLERRKPPRPRPHALLKVKSGTRISL